VERRDRLVAGDRLLVTSLLPECDASHAGSRASVLYAAPPPPPLPAIPGLPRRHFIHPARYLDFLDLPALRIRLVDSSPGHLGSLLSGPANSSNVQTCLPTVSCLFTTAVTVVFESITMFFWWFKKKSGENLCR